MLIKSSGSEDNSDSDAAPAVKTFTTSKAKPTSKARPANPKVLGPKPGAERKPAISEVKPGKSKLHSASSKVPKTENGIPHAANILGAATSDINTLPEFARSTWGNTFLPTLYDRLGRAPDPFLIDADMVKVIQEVVDLSYPDSDYQVHLGDRIFALVSLLLVSYSREVTDIFLGEGSPQ